MDAYTNPDTSRGFFLSRTIGSISNDRGTRRDLSLVSLRDRLLSPERRKGF